MRTVLPVGSWAPTTLYQCPGCGCAEGGRGHAGSKAVCPHAGRLPLGCKEGFAFWQRPGLAARRKSICRADLGSWKLPDPTFLDLCAFGACSLVLYYPGWSVLPAACGVTWKLPGNEEAEAHPIQTLLFFFSTIPRVTHMPLKICEVLMECEKYRPGAKGVALRS